MTTVSTVGHLSACGSRSPVKAVDRSGDQQPSLGEFTSVLNRLVGELTGGHSTGGLGSAATAVGTATPLTHTSGQPSSSK
jgi:hypothetical protein